MKGKLNSQSKLRRHALHPLTGEMLKPYIFSFHAILTFYNIVNGGSQRDYTVEIPDECLAGIFQFLDLEIGKAAPLCRVGGYMSKERVGSGFR
ncbi:hypothetical protein RYX36_017069 [Vicia faba]